MTFFCLATATRNLVRVSEALRVLQKSLPFVGSFVREVKVRRKDGHQCNDEDVRPDRDPDGSHVVRRLLVPDDEAPGNAAGAVHRGDRGSREDALPLPRDVVGLVGAQRGPVAHVGAGGEERADVAHRHLLGEPEHAEAHDQADAVEDDDGSPQAKSVADHRGDDNGHYGVVVRRCGQKYALVLAEPHSAL